MQLPDNCYIGKMSVSPSSWRVSKSSIQKNWLINYRFHDPSKKVEYPKGYQVIIKGMNEVKDWKERIETTEGIMMAELRILKQDGYNPITKKYSQAPVEGEIFPAMPFIEALHAAMLQKECFPKTRRDIKSMLKYFSKAATELNLEERPVSTIKLVDINRVLIRLAKRPSFSNSRHNKYRTYLLILFKELVKVGSIEYNPVREVEKKKETRRIPLTLDRPGRNLVNIHLKKKKQNSFRLYMKIFYHTGARNTELLALKKSDIDLVNFTVKRTIRKGRYIEEIKTPMKRIAKKLWEFALQNCRDDDFIFSHGLVPGSLKIDESQINRRWKRHVKAKVEDGGLGLKINFNSFRHANSTEMVDEVGDEAAALNNGHKNTGMLVRIYDTKRKQRDHQKIYGAGNLF